MPHTLYPDKSSKARIETIVKERYPSTTFFHGFSKIIAAISVGFWLLVGVVSFISLISKGILTGIMALLICIGLATLTYFLSMLSAEYFLAIARTEVNTNRGFRKEKESRDKSAA